MLCNVALDGLEAAIIIKGLRLKTDPRHPNHKVHLVRYADDFVIIAPNKSALLQRIQMAENFLKDRGLELSLEKSKIRTIHEGFDYLGFKIRKYTKKYKMNTTRKQSTRH